MKYTFTIGGRVTSFNEYIQATNTNRFYGNKLKKETQEYIIRFIKEQIPAVRIRERIQLEFRWYEKNRRRDLDNVAAGKKFILDALQVAGTIDNDDQRHISSFVDRFFIDEDNPRVEVDLVEEE